jgi:hypothetical protein
MRLREPRRKARAYRFAAWCAAVGIRGLALLVPVGLLWAVVVPQPVSAHQPRLPGDATDIEVGDPVISAAYYARLQGHPVTYHFHANRPFTLYLNVLVPDMPGVTEDYSITVQRDGETWTFLSPGQAPWSSFYEPFGADKYRKGPTYRAEAPAGNYDLSVSNPTNSGKYVLAIGEQESFPLREMLRTFVALAQVKQYFGKPAVAVVQSPLVHVPLFALVFFAAGTTLLIRWLRRVRRRGGRL